ncbi:hypothetical protein Hanom_Chr01g00022091 [Helianthus anomalus]
MIMVMETDGSVEGGVPGQVVSVISRSRLSGSVLDFESPMSFWVNAGSNPVKLGQQQSKVRDSWSTVPTWFRFGAFQFRLWFGFSSERVRFGQIGQLQIWFGSNRSTELTRSTQTTQVNPVDSVNSVDNSRRRFGKD